jgi:hypothetical protein
LFFNTRTMDKVRKPNISESYTPSSESYSNYIYSFTLPLNYWTFCLVTLPNKSIIDVSTITLNIITQRDNEKQVLVHRLWYLNYDNMSLKLTKEFIFSCLFLFHFLILMTVLNIIVFESVCGFIVLYFLLLRHPTV